MTTIHCKNNFGEEVDLPIDKFFFRPSAYGFIVHDKAILVMRNKSNNKLWFPGGGIEMHERLEDGLKREVKEETGIEIEIKKLILTKENFFYYQPLDEAYHAFLFFYVCRPLTTNLVPDDAVDDLESEKPRWMPISKIKQDDISDLSEDIYNKLKQL
jgi:ADP-ribose pyrophosphatase YjhB (NUDIX family)